MRALHWWYLAEGSHQQKRRSLYYTYHFGDEYIRRKSELIRFLKATLPKKEAPHSD